MSKKIIVALVVTVLVAAGAAAVAYGVMRTANNTDEATTQTEVKKPLTQQEQKVVDGTKAEASGDTEKALARYKEARELCDNDDEMCTIDMNMKISMMEKFLEQEAKNKP